MQNSLQAVTWAQDQTLELCLFNLLLLLITCILFPPSCLSSLGKKWLVSILSMSILVSGLVSVTVQSSVCCLAVFTCTVFSSWLVYLLKPFSVNDWTKSYLTFFFFSILKYSLVILSLFRPSFLIIDHPCLNLLLFGLDLCLLTPHLWTFIKIFRFVPITRIKTAHFASPYTSLACPSDVNPHWVSKSCACAFKHWLNTKSPNFILCDTTKWERDPSGSWERYTRKF